MSAPYYRAPFTINNGDAASAIYLSNMCQVSAYCSAASVLIGNSASSTAQAQTEITVGNGLSLSTTSVLSVSSTISVSGAFVDATGNVRTLPVNPQVVNYAIVSSDAGGIVEFTSGTTITINTAVFTTGQACTVINSTASTGTIAQGTTTLTLAGTSSTGSRSLSPNGMATLVCKANGTFLIAGSGLF